MGGLTSRRRRSKKRKGSGLKGRARFERARERERERWTGIKDRREEEEVRREKERRENSLGCHVHWWADTHRRKEGSEGRYSGKFRVMQRSSSLSLSCLLSFFPFVHSLILLSCAYSPLTILSLSLSSWLTDSSVNFWPSLSLSPSRFLCSRVYTRTCARVSNPPPPPRPSPRLLPLGLWYQGCSFRLVSFRFSSLRISLRYARGDLGAQPPTRELVNYFAQRDTSFMLLSPLDPSLPPSLSLPRTVHTLSRSVPHRRSRFLSFLLGAAGFLRIRYLRRGAIRRQFPSSDKVCIVAAEHGC